MLKQQIHKIMLHHFWDKPLIIGLSGALLSILVYYGSMVLHDDLGRDMEVIQNFIEWFGVPYGLLIALVLVNVWAQYDIVDREFDREADAFAMMFHTVFLIQTADKKLLKYKNEVMEMIGEYVKHVLSTHKVEHNNPDVKKKGDNYLLKIRDTIGEIINFEKHGFLESELLGKLFEVMDVRGDRISHSLQRMPKTVWFLSLLSSIIWLIPFYGLHFENTWVGFVLISGVTFIVVSFLAIIRDLDDPFSGTWGICLDSWEELENLYDEYIQN
ncbi:MAG: DUF4239 domain-containing protein [candidate division KSB1 bacterium]|nr:DUF4239 domain-containing protein [candidate division KSB1 bacterium]